MTTLCVYPRPVSRPLLSCQAVVTLPSLDGVEHKFIDLGDSVTIHVADAGPADGPPVMLVHGFPENWWEWHELIGPLAADGYRVLCPDLRGAGWSSAPRSRYLKNEMADDLAAVLDRLDVGPVKLVAHDWGGPVAFIMMLRHPAKVTGFFGLNTAAPYVQRDLSSVSQHLAVLVSDPDVAAGDRAAPDRRSQGPLLQDAGVVGRRRIQRARGRHPYVRRVHAPARARGSRVAVVSHLSEHGDTALAARRIRRRSSRGPGPMAEWHPRSGAHTGSTERI